jgi:hypothetical protein
LEGNDARFAVVGRPPAGLAGAVARGRFGIPLHTYWLADVLNDDFPRPRRLLPFLQLGPTKVAVQEQRGPA